MADKFVSTTGNNGNVGSLASPWLTPEFGMATINSGDTLHIRGGTYELARTTTETVIANGTAGAYTTVRSYEDELVTIRIAASGSQNNMISFRKSGRNWQYIKFLGGVQDGITFDMRTEGGANQAKFHGFQLTSLSTNNKFITLENIRVQYCWGQGILGGFTEDLSLINCTVNDNGQRDLTDNFEHGFYGSGLRLLIDGGRYYNNAARGIQVYAQAADINAIIRNVRAYNNQIGININNPRGVLVYNCEVFDNELQGILYSDGNNGRIYHCSVHNNGTYGIQCGDNSITSGIEIKNNLVIDNGTQDIRVGPNASGAVVTWNRISKTSIQNLSGTTTLANNTFSATAAANWVDSTTSTLADRNYALLSGAPAIGNSSTNNVPNVGIDADKNGNQRNDPPDQGAHEFVEGGGGGGGGGGALGLWTAQLQVPAGTWLNSSRSGETVRFMIRKEAWDTSVSAAFKLVFRGRTDANYAIEKVSVVERDGATLNGVDGTNQQVTFGGTWAAGGTVPANGELYSDTITLALDESKDYFVTYYAPGSVGQYFDNTGGATNAWFITGDDATDIDWGAKSPIITFPHVYSVTRIEETAIPQVPESAPFIAHVSPYTVTPGALTTINTSLSDPNADLVQATALSADGKVALLADHRLCPLDEYTGA